MTPPDETAQAPSPSSAGTTSADYSSAYYDSYHSPGLHNASYDWDTPHWRTFFTGVAARLVAVTSPATSLDIGCAKGMLVQALAEQGVDSEGFDISEDAIAGAHEDVRHRLRVASATEPLTKRYDVISCVEVLEHLSPSDAQQAIDVICAATDLVLFSSSPADFEEPTHVNTRPTAQWVAWFAERGFFRRVDVDPTFLAPWAVVFERADLPARTIVERYESLYDPVRRELHVKKDALLETQRRLTQAIGAREVELDDDAILARHAELTARDNVMGLEARVATLQRQLHDSRDRVARLRERLRGATDEVAALRGSRTWRLGRMMTAPARRLR